MPHCRWFLVLALALFVSVPNVVANQNIALDVANSHCSMSGGIATVRCNWHRTQQPCGSPTNYLQSFSRSDPVGADGLCCLTASRG